MPALEFAPATTRPDLLAVPVRHAIAQLDPEFAAEVRVSAIDSDLADTAAFCEAYGVTLDASANCIVVAGRRGDTTTYAACVVLATTRADVNGTARRLLDARRVSFAPTEDAVRLTGMEYGGITPLGLPADWRILIDSAVIEVPEAIIGAGIRAAKIAVPGALLASLTGAEVVDGLARPV